MRAACAYGHFYALGKGETLAEVAARYGITLEELLHQNPCLNPAYYLPGQVIIVPRSLPEETFCYITREDEQLSDLLRKFEISIAKLRILNPELDIFQIPAGQEIILEKGTGDYIIKEGETLKSIAEKFAMDAITLLRRNPHLRPDEFLPGQRIHTAG